MELITHIVTLQQAILICIILMIGILLFISYKLSKMVDLCKSIDTKMGANQQYALQIAQESLRKREELMGVLDDNNVPAAPPARVSRRTYRKR